MKEIIKLMLRYHFTIIFLILEVVAFTLIVQHNKYQRTVFFSHTSSFFCYTSSLFSNVEEYFILKETNTKLVEENTNLKNAIECLKITKDFTSGYTHNIDTIFQYKTAKIINANFNKTKNYITLNKGAKDGFTKEMAICSNAGIIGVIKNTSEHYSIVLPLININLRVSAKVKKNGYYGSLQWDGKDYRHSNLNDIPFHVNVEPGDTIVTSGFSSIFPEGELIGFVESVNKETANFLSIKVKLAVDFKQISNVYIAINKKKEEKQQLEANSCDE